MDLTPLVNKTVECRFSGRTTRIALSHALFSSFDVDAGTRLLLKALGENRALEGARSMADVGSGTGVIGIAAAAAFPELSVTAIDRDALALAFTRMNAAANSLDGRIAARAGLLMDFAPGENFDRIVSNLPAKAGKEALSDFLRRAPSFLTSGGSVWIVIVNTLAAFAASEIAAAGHESLFREAGKEHNVFGFRARDGAASAIAPESRLAPYLRGDFAFSLCGTEYGLECARGIPDFDTPGFHLQLCAKFLSSRHCDGMADFLTRPALIWNPGQGHLPAFLGKAAGAREFALAGRDLLELLVTRANLERLLPQASVCTLHLEDPGRLADGEFPGVSGLPAAILAFPDIVPGYAWAPGLFDAARALLDPGGSLVVCAPSAALSFLDKKRPEGFIAAGDRREKAKRAARFVRR